MPMFAQQSARPGVPWGIIEVCLQEQIVNAIMGCRGQGGDANVVLHGCTPRFDIEFVFLLLQGDYFIETFTCCPTHFNVPYRRNMRFTTMVRKYSRLF